MKNNPNVAVGTRVALNYLMFRTWSEGNTIVIENNEEFIIVQEEDKEPIRIMKYYPSNGFIRPSNLETTTHTVFTELTND